MSAVQLNEPVAIVGSACRFPGGANSPSALWKLLENPRDVSVEIPPDRFDTTTFYHPDGNHHGTTNVRQSYLLQENVRVFDAAFFNISPNEAESIDPQQRILLETVYEALEAGGHSIDYLKGSDTAVYAGTMTVDYVETIARDHNTMPTYFATGSSRAIISNRVSYFFDWHGPSMTIDTACSSSLIAVHQGVKALRTGESHVAVAAGTQVILNPEMYINESKLKMLSPTGRSRMWDADADGYARGEGVAVIVMKLLKDAIADGDDIECIVRETGANQDGFSNGLTVPNADIQAQLIQKTYAKAGLDPENNPRDRPQFFEAHGTGTQAGDPKEAAAIYKTFAKNIESSESPLYVGSVKTVIGHLEGAAGLAGVLKGSAMIQAGFMTPNLLFNRLNPRIAPFYKGMQILTQPTPWPTLLDGVPRRVSVNSFGFGGSNAHAILEQYQPTFATPHQNGPLFSPFLFSAASESSLVAQLQAYSAYLKTHQDINVVDLAWTLHSRRSHLGCRAAFSALTIDHLSSKIDAKLAELKNTGATIGTRSNNKAVPHLLGIFTGQGAQWPAMGAKLIRTSEFVRKRIELLEQSLATLPLNHRPTWSLVEEMLAEGDTSRISEAVMSQPLCTAVQIVLVDLLQAAGITFSAVVGHSSGEIAAAYAAGVLSDTDCIRIAYYRGLYARLAGNQNTGQKGAMLAVGTSWEDAEELVNLRAFKGRLSIAAYNSPASMTLSGDVYSVIHAKKVLDEEKKFSRILKVDTAYHSHHMLACGDPYVLALRDCGIQVNRDRPANAPAWFSSVTASTEPVDLSNELQDVYWRDNMCNPVLFSQAVQNALLSDETMNVVVEVGPHPALQGPTVQNVSPDRTSSILYTGVLKRGIDDVEAFANALGSLWTVFPRLIDFQAFEKTVTGDAYRRPQVVTGLPKYEWDHSRTYWTESRISRRMRHRKSGPHEILGMESPDSNSHDMRWLNILKQSEIPWLEGHQLQGQTVFPAAGYVAMALEASRYLAGDRPVELFELHNLVISKAIAFEEGDRGAETLVALTAAKYNQHHATAEFACYSSQVLTTGSNDDMELIASGTVKIIFGSPGLASLAGTLVDDYNMAPVDEDMFYSTLDELGYGYHGPFRTMSSMKRRLNQSSVSVKTYTPLNTDQTEYMVHPTTLDVAFQSSILAYSAPGDGRLWSISVPTSIGAIRVNPEVCKSTHPGTKVPVCSALEAESESLSSNIDIFSEDGEYGMVQIENLTIKPFAPATAADDRILFTRTELNTYQPDGTAAVQNARPSAFEVEIAIVSERISYYYLRRWKSELSDADWTMNEQQPHWAHLNAWVDEMLSQVSKGEHPTIKKEYSQDSHEEIQALISRYRGESIDVKVLQAVGENLPAAVRGETTILEHLLSDNMLDDMYKKGLGFERYNFFLARMMKQLTHRYPHSRILEIGAGTGGATKAILETIRDKFSSYTYTDLSVGFFSKAAALFKPYADKISFKVLDIEKAPTSQGYEPQSYDIVVASNVLHATRSIQKTLEHTRQLLKPGGWLMLLEITGQSPIRYHNTVGTLAGWWLGVDDGRKFSPLMTPALWNTALRRAGFGGVDAITPEIDGVAWPYSIIASQAVNDRVNFLRRPLSAPSSAPRRIIDSMVIMGNKTLETFQLSEDLMEHIGRFCGETTILSSLPTEAEALNLAPGSTFVNLVDLDTPIFENMTASKMDGLKRMLELSKRVIWVTQCAQMDQPYHMSSIAFSRALRMEESHLSLNHIDISGLRQSNSTSKTIAEYVIRQSALDEWQAPPSVLATPIHREFDILWSKEYEVFLDSSGRLQIPRLVENDEQNARLNSLRRTLTKSVPISKNIQVIPNLANTLSDVVEQIAGRTVEDDSLISIQASSLLALNVDVDIFLFLGIGKSNTQDNLQVVLSTSNFSQVRPLTSVAVPASLKANMDTNDLLVAVASELIADALMNRVSTGSHILLHASRWDVCLASALSRRATAESIRLSFSCDSGDQQQEGSHLWLKIDAGAPNHVIRKHINMGKPTHFVDLTSGTADLGQRIAQVIPSNCTQIDASTLFRRQSSLPNHLPDPEVLLGRLKEAVSRAKQCASDLVVPLDRLRDLSHTNPTSGIQWPLEGLVEAEVRALDTRNLFSKDKSYLLVGLTGQLGQSLAHWMASNGAGCVILTSRQPEVDKTWLDSFQGSGTTVKIMAMDVLDRNSLETQIKDISMTCPPIGGVANGAMVLEDTLFSKMSTETMQKVLGPKINGSQNLDDIFHNDDLDFFVLLSSVACVLGNGGQSNYSAANGYLHALARKRRRRGLAASVIDIGRVTGIGYIEGASQVVREQLKKLRLAPISEVDFRQAFAETIQAGYPDPETDQEAIPNTTVTTGIWHVRDDEEIKGPWFSNPLFSHLVIEGAQTDFRAGTKNDKLVLPISQVLPKAANREEALVILQDALSTKLRVVLQLGNQAIDPDTHLAELGIDSLVAVEVRSWFLKELKVDIPVLKIVSGASLAELCERAFDKLPKELEPAGNGKPESQDARRSGRAVTAFAQPIPLQSSEIPTLVVRENQAVDSNSSDTSESPSGTTMITTPDSQTDKRYELTPDALKPADFLSPTIAPKSAPTSIMTRRFLKSERISLSQSRFWFLRHLLEDQTTPNVVLSCHLTGDLRIGDLEKAIRIVTTRHEALRSCFVGDVANAGEAYQKVMPNSPLRLERKTIYAVEDVPLEYKKLQSHVFDLENGDIMRLILLQLSTSEYYLLVNYHHIVMDGFSFQVFLSDLEKAYDGQSLGEPPLQYTDVSAAQRRSLENDGFSEEYKYWRAVFPADEEPPVLPLLPMARTSVRVAMKNFDTHQVGRWLAPEVLRRVKSISKAQRSTPFHLHLAVFKAMLFSFAGPDTRDLTIGIADAARNDSRSRDSIGLFLNLLPLRFRQQHNQTSAEAIAEARDTTYAALSSSSLPFDVLLSEFNIPRSSLHSPFFQAFIDYRQGSPEKQSWSNIQLAYQDIHPGRTAYDITLDVLDNPDSAYIMIRVQKSLYDVTAANLLVETYLHFLDAFTKDARLVFEEIPRFSKTQRAEAVKVGRGPDMLSDWPATLPHRIDQIAQENRGKVALMDDTGKVLTYSDMICRAEAMAEALQNAGVRAGSRVLVFQQPTVDWPCSMLAIMRIGAIYVPLDLRNPLTRLAVVAQDSEASAALVDATTAGDAPHLQISVIINVSSLAQRASTRIHNSAHPASPAAVLYTSGSTGTPKGIVVTHAGLCNEIEGYTKTWGLKAERVLQQSAMTFNHASDQMYTGLVNGGMVYVVSTEKRGDPLEVTKIIQEQAITYTKATPSEYLLWLQYGRDKLRQASSWHFAFGGGEQLTKIITDEISRLGLPNLHFFNSYGPTEISISSHKMEIPYKDEEAMLNMGRISCGYSLPNYHTYIVDEKLKPMPIGMPGEICLGGAGVSLGYLNNQSLTDHHFVLNPFANSEDIKCGWTRMYRTGDIGYLREDGTMVFQSRIAGDTQVKIRGIRVELSDIENSIVSVAAGVLKEAIVTLHKNDLLVAHVMFTAQNTGIEEKHALLDRILHQLPLPQYMIPAVAIPVERFPMSNHAKVDRKAVRDLPLPERTNFNDTAELELTETMLQLKVMWEQTLGERRKQLGMNITRSSNFFLVGGNSILVIHLQAQIRQVFNIIIPLYKLLGLNTLGDMARIIDESNSALDIDWELETRPSSIPNFLADIHTNTKSATKHKKTLLITGGTGFTAGYLLPKLVSRDDIETIHCVALRKKQRYRDPFTSSKVVYHRGDLSAPLLGLDQNTFYDLASQVDLIIHMGAVRSFFDNYHILRSSNTHPTKELIKLAAPRHVPIHFLSTHGVLPHESIDNPGSAAAHVPAADGNNGYVASKWASERLLERSAADLGIPSRIYRLVPSPSPQQNQNSKENVELLAEFSRLVDVSRKIPDMEGYSGRVDFAPAEQIALWLYEAFTNTTTVPKGTTQFYHYASPISLDAEELRVLIDAKNRQGFEVVPLLKWFGLIKAFGFGFLPTSQELTIDSVGTGQGIFTSRR